LSRNTEGKFKTQRLDQKIWLRGTLVRKSKALGGKFQASRSSYRIDIADIVDSWGGVGNQ